MTINEKKPPQPRSYQADGLEAFVQTLAERAEAADRRSADLAERVALLEGRHEGRRDSAGADSWERPRPTWISRLSSSSEDPEFYTEENELDERKFQLPESTFTFLITHDPLSAPFTFALFSIALSIGCLALTLSSSVHTTEDNRLGVPAGVDPWVRVAQFLGAIVGVLMEGESQTELSFAVNLTPNATL